MNIMKLKNKRHSRPARLGHGRLTGERGFTLIETMIAFVILMVAGFGAISLFLFSMNYGAGASDRARAFAIAQRRMEAIRSTAFADLPAASTTAVTETAGAVNDGDPRTFNITTTVSNADGVDANLTAGRQKIITIPVRPQNNGRWSSGTVTLTTYRASSTMGSN